MGYNLAFTNQTAANIENKEAPTKIDSAITKEPGNAYVNIVENTLSWIVKPKFLNNAPIAIKQQPNAIAGLSIFKIDLKPFRKYFWLIKLAA